MTTTVNAFHDYYSECIAVVISTAAHRRGSRNIYQGELCIGDGSGDVYWTQSYNDCRKMYKKKALGLFTPERKPFSLDERTFFLLSLSLSLSLSQSYERLNGRDFHLTASS